MIVSLAEMKRIEEEAFASGLTAEGLMDLVGAEAARSISQFFPQPGTCLVYAGKGNNGGDALVAARYLLESGWSVKVNLPCFEQELGRLPRKKHREIKELLTPVNPRPGRRPLIVLDGLLGVGASGALRENFRRATVEINRLRREEAAAVFSIDLPTGLLGEDHGPDPDCVEASFTLAVGFVKDALVEDPATRYVGRLVVLPLAPLENFASRASGKADLITGRNLSQLLPSRNFDSHKTQFGRIGIVAGSRGTIGAAILCAQGALHGGGGMITIYAREDAFALTAATAPPEIMVKPLASHVDVLEQKIDVLAIGPGLGLERAPEILEVVERAPFPTVVDADAINALAGDLTVLARCVGQRLLTPHPGEMSRLCPNEGMSRRELVEWFCLQYPVTLLLKGSRTIVAERGRRSSYNTTGNPGMGTGGMGDVLTGLCASLIGQGLSPHDAARLGAWLSGRAAERAIFNAGESEESLTPTRLIREFGSAFRELRQGVY